MKKPAYKNRTRINEQIRARELRVLSADGANLGVLSADDALAKAKEAGLDLIEISPDANPPVARITDYGKFQYEQKKKQREIKAKSHVTETKIAQVKIGTGEHDKMLKARKIGAWLGEGHRAKIDLFLWGRYKYMDFAFLKERLEAFLQIIPAEYEIADTIKKSPKGLSVIIEPSKKKGKADAPKETSSEQTDSQSNQNHEDK